MNLIADAVGLVSAAVCLAPLARSRFAAKFRTDLCRGLMVVWRPIFVVWRLVPASPPPSKIASGAGAYYHGWDDGWKRTKYGKSGSF